MCCCHMRVTIYLMVVRLGMGKVKVVEEKEEVMMFLSAVMLIRWVTMFIYKGSLTRTSSAWIFLETLNLNFLRH